MAQNNQSVVEKVKALLSDAEPDTLNEIREHIDSQLPSPEAPAGAYDRTDGTPLAVETDTDYAKEAEKADEANRQSIESIADAGKPVEK